MFVRYESNCFSDSSWTPSCIVPCRPMVHEQEKGSSYLILFLTHSLCIIECMSTPHDVITALEHLAPLRLAAEWDNVGLLVGTKRRTVQRVMTCLTLTMDVAREAVSQKADFIVTHHPLPFRPLHRITEATATGGILLELLTAGIGVWSGHTAWDSAARGINAMLADMLSLQNTAPLEPDEADPSVGFGRVGTISSQNTVGMIAQQLASALGCPGCHVAGNTGLLAKRIGIVCGSGGESVPVAAAAGCQTLVTGEIKLHDALTAQNHNMAVVSVGHHQSERFAMERMSQELHKALPDLHCWASLKEADPLQWIPAT